MYKLNYLLYLWLLGVLSCAAAEIIQGTTENVERIVSAGGGTAVASTLGELRNYDLACWQDGQQIINEKGLNKVALGEELLKSPVALQASKTNGQTVTVVNIQKAICSVRGH